MFRTFLIFDPMSSYTSDLALVHLSSQPETSRTDFTLFEEEFPKTWRAETSRTDYTVIDDDDSDDEGRFACDNKQGLMDYLAQLEKNGIRIAQVTHVVNKWIIDGVVLPMKHHGLVFKLGKCTYLRTHLVREGLAWKVYDDFPPLPETTCQVDTYNVDSTVIAFRKYCAQTEEWSWPNNDCENWARGAMKSAGVEDRSPTLLGSLMSVCHSAPSVNKVVI